MMPVTVPVGRKFTYLFFALLAFGLAVSYSNGFGIGFYFDDTYGIANNPAIRSLRNIPSFFVNPHAIWTEPTQVDLRPVLLITYAVNYAISGVQPWSYHVLNLILHFIASVLVFILVRDHIWWPASERGADGAARIPAATAALFFALAPLNSQPVNYIWARSALLCVTLYLGAFLAFLRHRWTLGSMLFALALLTKAIAITLPVMFVIYDFIYRDRSRYPTIVRYLRGWRRLVVPLLLLGVLDAAYIGYRHFFLPDWTAAARMATGVTPGVWFMSQWSALLYYVRLFIWPDGLSADHDFPMATSLLATRAWGSLVVLLLWAGLAWSAMGKYPQVTFATAWFFLTPSARVVVRAAGGGHQRPPAVHCLVARPLGSARVVDRPRRGINSSKATSDRLHCGFSDPLCRRASGQSLPHLAVVGFAPDLGRHHAQESEQRPRLDEHRAGVHGPRRSGLGAPLFRARKRSYSAVRVGLYESQRSRYQ